MIIITLKLIETLALEAQKNITKKINSSQTLWKATQEAAFWNLLSNESDVPSNQKTLVSTNTKADLMHNGKMTEERTNNSPYNRT